MRSVRSVAEESWPLAAAAPPAPAPAAGSQERTILLDEPAGSPVGRASEAVTITLTATGSVVNVTCSPGSRATITVTQGGEAVLEETIKL